MQEIEKFVRWRLPVYVELLLVNYLVTVHDFLDKLLGFGLVHIPDLFDAHFVCLHEVFELCLQVGELFGELLVLDRKVPVGFLRLLLLLVETLDHLAFNVFVLAFLLLLLLQGLLVYSDLLLKHTMIEVKLLLVEFVHRLHVLHALLQNLHLLLELDLLLRLIVRVLIAHIL